MQYDTFNYSLKVWITTIVFSPLLFVFIMLLRTINNHPDDQLDILLFMYVMFFANSFLYSFLCLFVFWTLISWIYKKAAFSTKKKFLIALCIIILFPISYLTVNPYEDRASSNNLWLLLSYITIAALSTSYYKKPFGESISA